MNKHVLIFFLDGVGLGDGDPGINPFVQAHMPQLTSLLGPAWYLRPEKRGTSDRLLFADRATLV